MAGGTTSSTPELSPGIALLGYAGLVPALGALALALGSEQGRWIAPALGFAYSGLIFSFIGGAWWGLACLDIRTVPVWFVPVSILPCVATAILWAPWMIGWAWPGPELIALGLLIAGSPVVDRLAAPALALPDGWLRLRYRLSAALGLTTILLGLASASIQGAW